MMAAYQVAWNGTFAFDSRASVGSGPPAAPGAWSVKGCLTVRRWATRVGALSQCGAVGAAGCGAEISLAEVRAGKCRDESRLSAAFVSPLVSAHMPRSPERDDRIPTDP